MTKYVPTHVDLSSDWVFLMGMNVADVEHRLYRDQFAPHHYVVRRVSLSDGDSLWDWHITAKSVGQAITQLKELQASKYEYGLVVA